MKMSFLFFQIKINFYLRNIVIGILKIYIYLGANEKLIF